MLRRWASHSLKALDGGLGYTNSKISRLALTSQTWADTSPPGAMQAIDFRDLEEAINGLPSKERAAIVLYYQHTGCVYRQAAMAMGCSPKTAKRLIETAQTEIIRLMHDQKNLRRNAQMHSSLI